MSEEAAAIGREQAHPVPWPHRVRAELGRIATNRKIQLSSMVAAGLSSLAFVGPVQETVSLAGHLGASETTALIENLLGEAPHIDMQTASPYQAFNYLKSNFGVGDNFLDMGDGLMKNTRLSIVPSSLWRNTAALNAFYTLALQPGPHQAEYQDEYNKSLSALNYFWSGSSKDSPGRFYPEIAMARNMVDDGVYLDDQAWVALALLRDYRESHGPETLNKVEQIARLQATRHNHADGGGTYWKVQAAGETNHDIAAVSNLPYVRVYTGLYKDTKNPEYLRRAQQIFDWVTGNLTDEHGGLVNDHINGDGTINSVKWTYVQGVYLGAWGALSQYFPKKYPLAGAVEFAEKSMRYFKYCNYMGNSEFRAIYFQNLLWLSHFYPDKEFRAQIKLSMANAIANLPKEPSQLLHAAGAVNEIALNQLPPKQYGNLF